MVGSGTTDAAGRIEMRRPLPRSGERIEVHCPSRQDGFMRSSFMRSKTIGSAPFVIRDGHAEATIEVDASGCVEPSVHSERRRFAGLYDTGFENSTFLPCEGMPAEAAYYDRAGFYWANVPRNIGAALHRAVPATEDDWRRGRRLYVEWLGTSTGPGIYGHMGAALYDLDVEALYKVSATIPASCHPPGLGEFPIPPPPPPPTTDEAGSPLPVTS